MNITWDTKKEVVDKIVKDYEDSFIGSVFCSDVSCRINNNDCYKCSKAYLEKVLSEKL